MIVLEIGEAATMRGEKIDILFKDCLRQFRRLSAFHCFHPRSFLRLIATSPSQMFTRQKRALRSLSRSKLSSRVGLVAQLGKIEIIIRKGITNPAISLVHFRRRNHWKKNIWPWRYCWMKNFYFRHHFVDYVSLFFIRFRSLLP